MRMTADQEVTSHSYLRDHYLGWGQRLNIYILFSSTVVLFLTLASAQFVQAHLGLPEESFQWIEGLVVFATFCLSLVDLAWNPASKAKAHDQAVSHFLRMIYEVDNALGLGGDLSADKVRWIHEEFLDTADMPRIREDMALRFKQRHLIKLAMGRMLETNPHQLLWWLRLRLWWSPGLGRAMPSSPPPGTDGLKMQPLAVDIKP